MEVHGIKVAPLRVLAANYSHTGRVRSFPPFLPRFEHRIRTYVGPQKRVKTLNRMPWFFHIIGLASSCFTITVTPVQWWVKGNQPNPFPDFDNPQKQNPKNDPSWPKAWSQKPTTGASNQKPMALVLESVTAKDWLGPRPRDLVGCLSKCHPSQFVS